MIFNYFMISLSNFVTDGLQKKINSWTLIYFVSTLIGYNFLKTIYYILYGIYAKEKIKYYERRLARHLAKLARLKRERTIVMLDEFENYKIITWKWYRSSGRAAEAKRIKQAKILRKPMDYNL